MGTKCGFKWCSSASEQRSKWDDLRGCSTIKKDVNSWEVTWMAVLFPHLPYPTVSIAIRATPNDPSVIDAPCRTSWTACWISVCIYRLGPPQTHCLLLLTNSWHDNDSVPTTGPAGLLLFPTVIQDSVQMVPVSPGNDVLRTGKPI